MRRWSVVIFVPFALLGIAQLIGWRLAWMLGVAWRPAGYCGPAAGDDACLAGTIWIDPGRDLALCP